MILWQAMRATVWLLVAAACNQAFDLSPTHLPPPDAPFACPDLGTVPQFSTVLYQSVRQFCDFYSVSPDTGTAMGECFEPMSFIGYGRADTKLAPVPEIPADRRYPRLSPEGDRVYVSAPTIPPTIEVYALAGQTWSLAQQIALVPTFHFSQPTRVPRHLIAFTRTDQMVHELVETGDTWAVADSYPILTLGATDAQDPVLTPDGLRLVYYGTLQGEVEYRVLYVDRPAITQRFGASRAIEGAPAEYDPFMTSDCSRLYFSSADLQQVLYLRQP